MSIAKYGACVDPFNTERPNNESSIGHANSILEPREAKIQAISGLNQTVCELAQKINTLSQEIETINKALVNTLSTPSSTEQSATRSSIFNYLKTKTLWILGKTPATVPTSQALQITPFFEERKRDLEAEKRDLHAQITQKEKELQKLLYEVDLSNQSEKVSALIEKVSEINRTIAEIDNEIAKIEPELVGRKEPYIFPVDLLNLSTVWHFVKDKVSLIFHRIFNGGKLSKLLRERESWPCCAIAFTVRDVDIES